MKNIVAIYHWIWNADCSVLTFFHLSHTLQSYKSLIYEKSFPVTLNKKKKKEERKASFSVIKNQLLLFWLPFNLKKNTGIVKF